MAQMRCLLLVAASALLAACTAANEPLESSRGTAVRIVDDVDALEAAMEAEDHCDRYDRHPVCRV
jgi:outer membrane biogenesis lipoprotein LolB